VDAIAMARFIAAGQRVRGPIALLVVPSRLRLGLVVAVIALVGALVGGAIVAGGRLFERDRDPMLPEGGLVGPFIGLPPAGATPSRPAIGNLVLEASGRCTGDGAFCFVWLYADGRLIWLRDGALPFGANEGSTGLLEQRLAPSGVERLVSAFMATGACSGADRDEPIICSPPMPGPAPFPAIPDPGWIDRAWGLATSAWEDPAIRGFVPSTFAACFLESNVVSASSYTTWQRVDPAPVLGWLPQDAADLLRGRDIEFPRRLQGLPGLAVTCFAVTTEVARSLSDVLSRAGLERDQYMASYLLGYRLEAPRPFQDSVIWVVPILPHGRWVVSGFG
jgi:hypothetical protein